MSTEIKTLSLPLFYILKSQSNSAIHSHAVEMLPKATLHYHKKLRTHPIEIS